MTAVVWHPEGFNAISRYGFPHHIARLLPTIWLDAQDYGSLSFNGSNVSAWRSKTNSLVASQATAANQPLYVASAINGHPALQGYHAGVASQLSIPDTVLLDYTQYTTFTVVKRVTDMATNEMIIAKYNDASSQFEFYTAFDAGDNLINQLSIDGTFPGRKNSYKSSVANGASAILCGYFDGSIVQSELNNVAGVSGAATQVFNGTANYTLFSRSSFSTITLPFAGYIGEHLFFTRALSAAERTIVYNYLKQKWGL